MKSQEFIESENQILIDETIYSTRASGTFNIFLGILIIDDTNL